MLNFGSKYNERGQFILILTDIYKYLMNCFDVKEADDIFSVPEIFRTLADQFQDIIEAKFGTRDNPKLNSSINESKSNDRSLCSP